MKVLLPLDRSAESEQVIPLMVAEAPGDAEFTLLRVIRPEPTRVYEDAIVIGPGTVAFGSGIEEAEIDQSLAYLSSVVRRYEVLPSGTRCEAHIASSSSRGIVEFAQSEGMDLIAMYVRERTGLAGIFKGRTAKNVVRTSKVEVRTFRPASLEETDSPPMADQQGGAVLAACQLFRTLTSQQRDSIWAAGETENVTQDQVLAKEGTLGLKLYVILSGEAQLSAPSAVGHIPVRVAKPGDTFPLASLLGADALITTAKAMTSMKVLSIPTADLIKICVDDAEIGAVVFREAAKVFADRYSDTLRHLARAVEREADPGEKRWPPAD